MKKLLLNFALIALTSITYAQDMSRINIANENIIKYQIIHSDLSINDPDFAQIYERLLYGDVLGKVKLSNRYKGLAYIVAVVSTAPFDKAYEACKIALDLGVTPLELKEAVYQCAPYVGIEKVKGALPYINKAMLNLGINLPLKSTATTNEYTRFDVGKKIQIDTYGQRLKNIHNNTPPDEFYLQVYNLSAYCFGDFYSRAALNMKDREIITCIMIASLGGQEAQLKSHIQAAFKEGASKEELIGTLSVLNPFIGYPRTLSALAIIREESNKEI